VNAGAVRAARGPAVPPAWLSLKYDYLNPIIGVNPQNTQFANKKV
jgi:hypothetical protein